MMTNEEIKDAVATLATGVTLTIDDQQDCFRVQNAARRAGLVPERDFLAHTLRATKNLRPTPEMGSKQILVKTRCGTHVHRGHAGSSVTRCGVWMRTNGINMQVDAEIAQIPQDMLCEKCFG